MKRPRHCRRGCLLLAAACLWPAAGRPAEPMVPYVVQPGDSLYGVAERLLDDPADWPLLARLNQVRDPRRLSPGQQLWLPASRLVGEPGTALVLQVRGSAQVAGGPQAVARALAPGEALKEGASLDVAAGGGVVLRLADGSLVSVSGGSRVLLHRLRTAGADRRGLYLIRLDGGRVDSSVAPQRPGSRFQVRTPLAVAGVRGTRFGVAMDARTGRAWSEVVEGQVAVADTARGQEVAVAAGQAALVVAGGARPRVRPLLPAPEAATAASVVERWPLSMELVPVAGAVRYRAQLATDASLADVRYESFTDQARLVLPGGVADGHYLLSVRAVDAEGIQGQELRMPLRVKTTPVPPLVQSPRPGQTFGPGDIELRCTEVAGGESYRLQLFDTAHPGTPVLERTEPARCLFNLSGLAPGHYRWRVATVAQDHRGAQDQGPFGDSAAFVVLPLPPVPQPEVRLEEGVSLYWMPRPGERYQVQLARDDGFREPLQDLMLDAPPARFHLKAGCQPYYLRMRTTDEHGLSSPFSATRRVAAQASVCTADGTVVEVEGGRPLESGAR